MIGKLIYEQKEDDLKISIHDEATPAVYKLIENMVWGTKGPRFYKIDTHIKIDNSIHPHFMLLWIKGKFAGMCTISQREAWFVEEWLPTYYLQFFAINPKFQGKSYGNILVASVRDYFESIIDHPAVSYAYIEGENVRSDKVAHFIKYEHVAKFKTILFGRMYPKSFKGVRLAKKEEYKDILEKIHEFYKDYSYAHFDYVFNTDRYWVLEENGEIVAGVQVHPQRWKFVSIPGISGKFIHKILPYIPIAKRIFNAQNHQFLCFEGHYCKAGHEQSLVNLMEHCLHYYKKTSGMNWFDERSSLYQNLQQLKPWGLLDKIEGKHSANVYAKLHNIPEERWELYKSKPLYIAAYDCV